MKRIALPLLCSILGLTTTTSAWSYGLGPANDPQLETSARSAARYLSSAQLLNRGWEWEIGSQKVADNYGGLVAEALLAAHEQTGEQRYLEAARAYADELVRRQQGNPQQLPYKPDLELLVRMTEVSGEPSYAHAASQWFTAIKQRSPTGDDEVGRILVGRAGVPELVGYDVALGIRAALAVEEYAYAGQLADRVLSERPRWLRTPGSIYGTVARAALLDALNMLGQPRHAAVRSELAAGLMAQQDENGSWCMNETQATAYAVRALSSSGSYDGRQAAHRGAAWLSKTLLQRGAWADYHDGMPEPFVGTVISAVNAEALSAVILAGKI